MKLFCIPYAGGSSAVYYEWKRYLPEKVNMISIDYQGHGRRVAEGMPDTMKDIVEDLFRKIVQNFDGEDYSFFGHSMGSIVAYELYYKIKGCGFRGPEHIFFSGHASPDCSNNETAKYLLPDKELILAVKRMGGFSEAVLQEECLVRTMLPIIRNDFRIVETYQHAPNREKMNCPISILYGVQDTIAVDDLKRWAQLTIGKTSFYGFDGNHFFINDFYPVIAKIISGTLIDKQILNLKYVAHGNLQYVLQEPLSN